MDLWKGFKLATQLERQLRLALQHHHRPRRQRRHGEQRSARRPRPQRRARTGHGGKPARASAMRSASASASRSDGGAGGPMVVMHRVGGGGDASMGGFSGRRRRQPVPLRAVCRRHQPVQPRRTRSATAGSMTSPFFGQATSAGAPRRSSWGRESGSNSSSNFRLPNAFGLHRSSALRARAYAVDRESASCSEHLPDSINQQKVRQREGGQGRRRSPNALAKPKRPISQPIVVEPVPMPGVERGQDRAERGAATLGADIPHHVADIHRIRGTEAGAEDAPQTSASSARVPPMRQARHAGA